MSSWGNTDNHNQKPKWDVERETREIIQLPVFAGNTAGNTIISVVYNDGGQNNVANIGVQAGQYVYFWANGVGDPAGGQKGNGTPGFFASNTTVSSTSGNTITLSTALFGAVTTSFIVEFDKSISYNTNKPVETTYNSDTILVTPSRKANSNSTTFAQGYGGGSIGWVHYQRKVNSDGTVRIIPETLVALANPVAANTTSGNTSFGQLFNGV